MKAGVVTFTVDSKKDPARGGSGAEQNGRFFSLEPGTLSSWGLTITDFLIDEGYGLAKHLIGVLTDPYQTYRELGREKCLGHLLPITGGSLILLSLASWLRGDQSLILPTLAALATMVLTGGALYWFGRLLGGRGSLRAVISGWGFTYIPTLVWFGMVLGLYLLFPPPRTTRFLGNLLSVVFIAGSVGLLLWKLLLYYLTLRLTLKLKPSRIIFISVVFLPAFIAYSLLMYKLGIFRIPFI